MNLWDIRKFATGTNSKKTPKPFATQTYKKSINSAFFSPSGHSLLTTTMTDRLDLFDQAHNLNGKLKPTKSISHNNQTGRWLTTFMARWHPSLDIFISGSMNKPRCVEAFDAKGDLLVEAQGEALNSVMSRCCFHPSTDKIVMVGGNSSGRVVAIR
jgi:WD repeat-containing protein 76